MAVVALPAEQAAKLRAAPYNYEHVGHTAHGQRVPGYGWMERSTQLRRTDFEGAVAELFRWQVQERAGLRVKASEAPLEVETVVLMRLGIGPLSLRIPCRVVYAIDQPRLRGFAYGPSRVTLRQARSDSHSNSTTTRPSVSPSRPSRGPYRAFPGSEAPSPGASKK